MNKSYYKDVPDTQFQPGPYLESPRYYNSIQSHQQIYQNQPVFHRQINQSQSIISQQPQHIRQFSPISRIPQSESRLIQSQVRPLSPQVSTHIRQTTPINVSQVRQLSPPIQQVQHIRQTSPVIQQRHYRQVSPVIRQVQQVKQVSPPILRQSSVELTQPQVLNNSRISQDFRQTQKPRYLYSTVNNSQPLNLSQNLQASQKFGQYEPPRYSDVYPRQWREEVLPYQYERPIITRERIPVGVDRPLSYQRYYDIYQPYHKQPYECSDCIQSTVVPNQDIKPVWVEWRGVEEFAYMFKEMLIYELRAERIRIELALQPDFNVGALYTQMINIDKPQQNQLNQEKACEEPLYFNTFRKALQFYNVDPDPWDLQMLLCRYIKFKKQEQSEVNIKYKDFYQLFYPVSKKDLFEQKLNSFEIYTEHFTNRTQALIEELLRTMLSQEDAYDYFRREIKKRNIEIEKVWQKLNPANRHDIQVENVRCYLMDYGFHFNREEINLLLLRYDKCRVGSVNFADFREELVPRLDIQEQTDKYWEQEDTQEKERVKP